MQQKKVSCKHRAEYALFSGLISLAKHVPQRALDMVEKTLVFFLKKGSPRHMRLIARNLALAFPDAPPAWRAELQENIYRHFGGMFIELTRAFARGETRAILERTRVEHIERLTQALARKRGVIIFSAHFGNWEWVPLILRDRLGREVHSVARPMDNPLIEKRVRQFREAMGSRIIYKQGSLRTILQLLAGNEIVCMIIDQNTVSREGVFVDFFARKAAAVTTAAQLYLKRGIPLVPVFLHYEGREIVLDILPEVDFPGKDEDPAALSALTQRLAALIEEQIRRFPEQWLWFHDRWKTQPQGEPHESQ